MAMRRLAAWLAALRRRDGGAGDADRWLLVITLLLLATGLAMVLSASSVISLQRHGNPYYFSVRQARRGARRPHAPARHGDGHRHVRHPRLDLLRGRRAEEPRGRDAGHAAAGLPPVHRPGVLPAAAPHHLPRPLQGPARRRLPAHPGP